jgi:hypothetical protein
MESMEVPLYPLGSDIGSQVIEQIDRNLSSETSVEGPWTDIPARWPVPASDVRTVEATANGCTLNTTDLVSADEPVSFLVSNDGPSEVLVGLLWLSDDVTQEDLAMLARDDSAMERLWWEKGSIWPTYSVTVGAGSEVEVRSEFLDRTEGWGRGAVYCRSDTSIFPIIVFDVELHT